MEKDWVNMEMERAQLIKAYKDRAKGKGINLMHRREARLQHRKDKEAELFNKRLADFHKNNHNRMPVPPELVPKMQPPKITKIRRNSVTDAKDNSTSVKNSHTMNSSSNSHTTKVINIDPFANPNKSKERIGSALIGKERLDATHTLKELNTKMAAARKAKEGEGPLKKNRKTSSPPVAKDDGSVCPDKKLGRDLLLSTSSHDAVQGYEAQTSDFKNGIQWRAHLRNADTYNVVPPPEQVKRQYPVLHPVFTIKMAQRLGNQSSASNSRSQSENPEDLKKYFDERLFLTLPTKY